MTTYSYIYILQTREFVNNNLPIYKIGKSKRSNLDRFNDYPNGSMLLYHFYCNDCDKCEKIILKLFNNKYKNVKKVGTEYFYGNYIEMVHDIIDILFKFDNLNQINIKENFTKKYININNAIELKKYDIDISDQLQEEYNIIILNDDNDNYNYLEKLTEITNCGDYHHELKNIIINDLKDDKVQIYDSKIGNFVACNKKKALNTFINNKILNVESIYNELITLNEIDDNSKKNFEDFLKKIKDENTKFIYQNITYPNYKAYKIHKLEKILYDNKNKILNDLENYLTKKD